MTTRRTKGKAPAKTAGASGAGWVDMSIPAGRIVGLLAPTTGSDAEVQAFIAFLGSRIGRYRAHEQEAADSIAPSEAAAFVGRLLDDVDSLSDRIQNLPDEIEIDLDEASMQAGKERFAGLQQRLTDDLANLCAHLEAAEQAINHRSGNRGRKPKTARDMLLDDVAERIATMGSMSKTAAMARAADVLRLCGVHVPDAGRIRSGVERQK